MGQWLKIELKEAADIQNIRILWEKNNAAYRYTVEASADGKNWKQVVDQSNNKDIKQNLCNGSRKRMRVCYIWLGCSLP